VPLGEGWGEGIHERRRSGHGDADAGSRSPKLSRYESVVRDVRNTGKWGAMTSTRNGMDRRAFLRLFGAVTTIGAGGLLQACSGGSTPAPTAAPAKPAESKPAEAAKPAAPAAAPAATTAP